MGLIPASWPGACYVFLACHCALTCINGFQWANFVPVPDEAKTVFGMDNTQINNLMLVYVVIWAPVMPLSIPLQSTGPWAPLVLASFLNAFAALLKLVAYWWYRGYGLIVAAQAVAGAAEVFFLPLPALIASTWFSAEARTVACAVASLCNSLGIALAYAVTPRLVEGAPTDAEGFFHVFIFQLAVSGLIILVALTLPRKPATPPSITASQPVVLRELPQHLKDLAKNRNYLMFVVASGLSLAVGWVIAGTCAEFLKPYGVSEDNAGLMGSLFTLCGALGQGVAGRIGDRTRKYLPLITTCYGVALSVVCVMMIMIAAGVNPTAVGFVCLPTLGFFFIGSLPPMYEYIVELTYPTPIAAAVSLQMLTSRIVFSPIINPVASALISNSPDKTDTMRFLVAFTAFFLVCLLSLALVKDDRRRLAAETRLKFLASVDSQSLQDRLIRPYEDTENGNDVEPS
jgi:MFS family permease